jgi:hypothetical protein
MEADAYADSSFLVSLHRTDSFHDAALAFTAKAALSLAFTPALLSLQPWHPSQHLHSRTPRVSIRPPIAEQIL